MSDDEVDSVYMSAEELKAVRTDCMTFVRMMDEGFHLVNGKKQFCTRGLDQHTKAYTSRAQDIRDNIYDSVHAIQSFQGVSRSDASELISKLCQRFSEISAEQARAIAQDDARSAGARDENSASRKRKTLSPMTKCTYNSVPHHFALSETLGQNISSTMLFNNDPVTDMISQALAIM